MISRTRVFPCALEPQKAGRGLVIAMWLMALWPLVWITTLQILILLTGYLYGGFSAFNTVRTSPFLIRLVDFVAGMGLISLIPVWMLLVFALFVTLISGIRSPHLLAILAVALLSPFILVWLTSLDPYGFWDWCLD